MKQSKAQWCEAELCKVRFYQLEEGSKWLTRFVRNQQTFPGQWLWQQDRTLFPSLFACHDDCVILWYDTIWWQAVNPVRFGITTLVPQPLVPCATCPPKVEINQGIWKHFNNNKVIFRPWEPEVMSLNMFPFLNPPVIQHPLSPRVYMSSLVTKAFLTWLQKQGLNLLFWEVF